MKHVDIAQCMVTKQASSGRRGIEFNLNFVTMFNLKKQKTCFYTGVLLDGKTPQTTFSLERIDNDLGYIDGNVIVCSQYANGVRGDAAMEDIPSIIVKMEAKRDMYIAKLNELGYDATTDKHVSTKPRIPANQVDHYIKKVVQLSNIKKKLDAKEELYQRSLTQTNFSLYKNFHTDYLNLKEAYRQLSLSMERFIEKVDLNKSESERKQINYDSVRAKVASTQERIDTLCKVYKGLRLINSLRSDSNTSLAKLAIDMGLPVNSDIDKIADMLKVFRGLY